MGVPSASGLEAWIVALAGRPETYLAVAVVLALGAVITILPTQSLVVAVGALLIAGGDPAGPLALLALSTVVGMVAGDLLAYAATRLVLRVGDRHRSARRLPRLLRSVEQRVEALRTRFDRNPTVTVVIARLIPTGRIATDLLAADVRMTVPRFTGMAAVGGAVFAAFCLALAAVAGPFASRDPVAVAVGAVIVSLLLGVLIDAVDRRVQRSRRV